MPTRVPPTDESAVTTRIQLFGLRSWKLATPHAVSGKAWSSVPLPGAWTFRIRQGPSRISYAAPAMRRIG